jgi:branched-chain amino acid transport system permease protein
MLVSGGTAVFVALPTVRLRADYLAIATIAFAEVVRTVAINLEPVTAGTIGIVGIPHILEFSGPNAAFLNTATIVGVGAAILLGLFLALHFIVESPWGRVLRAIREDEQATMALGKNTFLYKVQVFAIGGALMGLAGWLFAVTLLYVEPSGSFAPAITFSVWVMVIVGGAGNLRGAIVGAFVVYGLEWLSVVLKDLAPDFLKEAIPYLRLVVVGFLLIILIIVRPEGILREKKRVLR